MIKIKPEEFFRQWIGNGNAPSPRRMASILDSNIENFITRAGEYSKSCFVNSFARGGFYGGSKWAPRSSKWGKKFTHPIMLDTKKLKSNIKGGLGLNTSYGSLGGAGSKNRRTYLISTNEESRAEKGKRGRKKRGRNNYAAIHNTDPKFGLYSVNQHSSRSPEYRQFIGFNTRIDDYINLHIVPTIFDKFPK